MVKDKIVLKCDNLSQQFGDKKVLYDIKLEIKQGEIVGLVGPSGCGKSTFFKAVLGINSLSEGNVTLYNGDKCNEPEIIENPSSRIGIVFQQYPLFPFTTAIGNVLLGLKLKEATLPFRYFHPFQWRKLKKEHKKRALEQLELFGVTYAQEYNPEDMSGGMCQRVAIGQSMILKPKILLLDEPFSALDEATREKLQRFLLGLYAENQEAIKNDKTPPYTILIVTHEINEAIYVSDRVVGLSQHWNWKKEGYTEFPGATIVYDKPTPVFGIRSHRDFEEFRSQKDEIYSTINGCEDRFLHQTFWKTNS